VSGFSQKRKLRRKSGFYEGVMSPDPGEEAFVFLVNAAINIRVASNATHIKDSELARRCTLRVNIYNCKNVKYYKILGCELCL
jgi:hypothetical protein